MKSWQDIASSAACVVALAMMQLKFGGATHAFFGTVLGVHFTPNLPAMLVLLCFAFLWMAACVDWLLATALDLSRFWEEHMGDSVRIVCTVVALAVAAYIFFGGMGGLTFMDAPHLVGKVMLFLWVAHWTNALLRYLATYVAETAPAR